VAQNSHGSGSPRIDGRVIISELLRNMELGQFEMAYTTVLPCIFRVYLHPEDHVRLSGIFPLIAEDARRALTARVSKMNTPPTFLGIRGTPPKQHKIAASDWLVQFYADTEDAVAPGNLEIHSDYCEAEQPGFTGVKTTLIDGSTGVRTGSGVQTRLNGSSERIYADIRYEDDTGPQVFLMTQNLVRVCRGADDEPMDLALYTNDEVSREHLVVRRDAATGQFYVADKSTNGTRLDGRRLKRDVEYSLPERAEIKAAEVITLLFQVRK
jgi:hypothetical protein